MHASSRCAGWAAARHTAHDTPQPPMGPASAACVHASLQEHCAMHTQNARSTAATLTQRSHTHTLESTTEHTLPPIHTHALKGLPCQAQPPQPCLLHSCAAQQYLNKWSSTWCAFGSVTVRPVVDKEQCNAVCSYCCGCGSPSSGQQQEPKRALLHTVQRCPQVLASSSLHDTALAH
jgi:hypothetical protein